MLLENSYCSSKMVRFLLVLGLFLLSAGVQAQEEPVADTAVAPPIVHEIGPPSPGVVEEVLDEETEEEEVPAPSLRQVPDSTVARLKLDPAFEYANDSAYWTEKPVKEK